MLIVFCFFVKASPKYPLGGNGKAFPPSIEAFLFCFVWPCGMASVSSDPHPSWAERSSAEVMDLDSAADPPSYAEIASSSHQRHESSSSSVCPDSSPAPDGDGLFVDYDARLLDSEKGTIHPFNLLPDRPCSVHFMLADKSVGSSVIFDDLKTCDIRVSGVRCLQRSPNGFVSITFSTADFRDLFLCKSSFIPRRRSSSSSSRYDSSSSIFTFVAVFDAPYELLDGALSHRLSRYGTVFDIRRCMLYGYNGIQTGTRVFKMQLNESIPSYLRFGSLSA